MFKKSKKPSETWQVSGYSISDMGYLTSIPICIFVIHTVYNIKQAW